MDSLELRVGEKEIEGRKSSSVDIFINGKNLLELLREYELPFATKEGHSSLAGGYAGMMPKDFLHWFIGGDWPSTNERPIYECGGCGEVGCWPMIITVSKEVNCVRWSNFTQPHRGSESADTFWDYSNFPTFEFSVENYGVELEKIRKIAAE